MRNNFLLCLHTQFTKQLNKQLDHINQTNNRSVHKQNKHHSILPLKTNLNKKKSNLQLNLNIPFSAINFKHFSPQIKLRTKMSYLPQISEEQSKSNKKKLIGQNKKLRQEIFVFEEQINVILKQNNEEQRVKQEESDQKEMRLTRKLSSRQKQLSQSLVSNNQSPTPTNQYPPSTQQPSNQPSKPLLPTYDSSHIQTLLQQTSPLLQAKLIPQLKAHLQHLKSLNVKENIHYILREEDQLKIIKKQLYKLRKQKQVVTGFVQDKIEKLRRHNNQLIQHKDGLRKELNDVVKFNRQSSANITEIQREIRKYHLTICEYKKLSVSAIAQDGKGIGDNKDKQVIEKTKSNPMKYLEEIEQQTKKINLQIAQIQSKWKDQLDSLDKQYYQLKEQLESKEKAQISIQYSQTFHKTRILVMKDQQHIQQQKDKQKLVKTSPRLQKQLKDYLKEEQEKIRKKEKYLKKHKPRDKDEEEFQEIILKSAASSPNPQNTLVETLNDDKNIVKLKHYLRQKEMIDKQVEAKIKNSNPEKFRLQRSWSQSQEEISMVNARNHRNINGNKAKDNKQKDKEKEKVMPRILLKSVKLGTTFHNESQSDHN